MKFQTKLLWAANQEKRGIFLFCKRGIISVLAEDSFAFFLGGNPLLMTNLFGQCIEKENEVSLLSGKVIFRS